MIKNQTQFMKAFLAGSYSILKQIGQYDILPRFYSSTEGYPYKTPGLLAGTLLI